VKDTGTAVRNLAANVITCSRYYFASRQSHSNYETQNSLIVPLHIMTNLFYRITTKEVHLIGNAVDLYYGSDSLKSRPQHRLY